MSILTKAEDIINGDRAKAYGSPIKSFTKIAKGWSEIFDIEVTPEQVALAMTWLKICRELNKHQEDNLVDIAGYAGVLEKLIDEKDEESTQIEILRRIQNSLSRIRMPIL